MADENRSVSKIIINNDNKYNILDDSAIHALKVNNEKKYPSEDGSIDISDIALAKSVIPYDYEEELNNHTLYFVEEDSKNKVCGYSIFINNDNGEQVRITAPYPRYEEIDIDFEYILGEKSEVYLSWDAFKNDWDNNITKKNIKIINEEEKNVDAYICPEEEIEEIPISEDYTGTYYSYAIYVENNIWHKTYLSKCVANQVYYFVAEKTLEDDATPETKNAFARSIKRYI